MTTRIPSLGPTGGAANACNWESVGASARPPIPAPAAWRNRRREIEHQQGGQVEVAPVGPFLGRPLCRQPRFEPGAVRGRRTVDHEEIERGLYGVGHRHRIGLDQKISRLVLDPGEISREVGAGPRGGGGDPVRVLFPARDVGGIQQVLAHRVGEPRGIGGVGREAIRLQARDHELGGTADQRATGVRVELGAQEDRAEQGADVEVGADERGGERVEHGRLGIGIREEAPEFLRDVARRGRAVRVHREDVVHDVGLVPVLGHAHERLQPVVVPNRVEVVLRGIRAEQVVAGQRASGGDNVVLRVLVHSQREELHQLTSEVLVGCAHDVGVVVEVDDHRGMEDHRLDERLEAAGAHGTEQVVLLVHELRAVDLVVAGHEMPVPEQRELFLEGRRARAHAIDPPVLEIEDLLPVAESRVRHERRGGVTRVPREVEDVVDDRGEIEGRQGIDL